MSNSGNGLKNEVIREMTGDDMSAAWQDLGGPSEHRAFVITVQNSLLQDVYMRRTTDPIINGVKQATMRFLSESGRILDEKTNDAVEVPGTQFEVMWAGAEPEDTSGIFSLEYAYV